jgi:hypothetical protein
MNRADDRSLLRKRGEERRDGVLKKLPSTPPKPRIKATGVSESVQLKPGKKGAPRMAAKTVRPGQ